MNKKEWDQEKMQETLLEEINDDLDACLYYNLLKASRAVLIWRGILFLLFGILMLIRPLPSLTVLILILAIYAILEGIAMLIAAFKVTTLRMMLMLNGILLLVLGIATLIFPWIMGEYAIIFLGAWQLVSGIQVICLLKRSLHRWKSFFAGTVAILSGLFFIFAPFLGLLAMGWVFAILFVLYGGIMLFNGIAMGKSAITEAD